MIDDLSRLYLNYIKRKYNITENSVKELLLFFVILYINTNDKKYLKNIKFYADNLVEKYC